MLPPAYRPPGEVHDASNLEKNPVVARSNMHDLFAKDISHSHMSIPVQLPSEVPARNARNKNHVGGREVVRLEAPAPQQQQQGIDEWKCVSLV